MSKNNNEDVEFENDGLDTSELNKIKPEPVKQNKINENKTPDGTDLIQQLSEEEKQKLKQEALKG